MADGQENNKKDTKLLSDISSKLGSIDDQGKQNTLSDKENKNENRLFFKNLLGEFKNNFKDVAVTITKPMKDKSIFSMFTLLAAGIPALGAGIVAGIVGQGVGIFQKIFSSKSFAKLAKTFPRFAKAITKFSNIIKSAGVFLKSSGLKIFKNIKAIPRGILMAVDKVLMMFQKMKLISPASGNKVFSMVAKTMNGFKNVFGMIGKLFGSIVGKISKLFGTIGKIFAGGGKGVFSLIKTIPRLIGKFMPIASKVMGVFFKFGRVLGKMYYPITIIIAVIEGAIEAFQEWQRGGSLLDIIGKFFAGIVQSLTFGLYDADKGIMENITGMVTWFAGALRVAVDWIQDGIDLAVMWFKNLLDDIGFWVKYDLPQFISDAIDGIIYFFTDGIPNMISDMWDFLTGDAFGSFVSTIWDMMNLMPSMVWDVVTSLFDFLTGIVKSLWGMWSRKLMDIGLWLGEVVMNVRAAIFKYLADVPVVGYMFGGKSEEAAEEAAQFARARAAITAANEKKDIEDRKLADAERERAQAERDRIRAEKMASRAAERESKRASRKNNLAAQQAERERGNARTGSSQGSVNNTVNTVVSNKTETYQPPPMIARDTNGPQFGPEFAM